MRSSSERRRHPKSPQADETERTRQHHTTISTSTRRASRSTSLLALGDEKPPKSTTPGPFQPSSAARSNSRKRPATVLAPSATADTRPPTRVTVAQPHGELFRITNGVSAPLSAPQDEAPPGVALTNSNGAGLTLPAPAATTPAQDKRSLRSHDGGTRLKSDLSIYFSNYDDVIADAPKAPGTFSKLASASPHRSRKSRGRSPLRKSSIVAIPPTQSSTAFRTLDYSSIIRHLPSDDGKDPLADAVYFAQHRRAERKEKQLRNIEKERAMHEKVQLERLLDGLQGPDWLKVMGISGVTDGERKDWEPKRDYFVKEVEALVDKFRIWKEEEKRQRAEKEAALHAREETEEDDEDDEAAKPPLPKPRRPPRPHGFFLPIMPPEPTGPFTSFYAKPHLRAAALGKHRQGRKASAFGQPIPEWEASEFGLPDEYLTEENLRHHARKRRRQKRESGGKK
ncbi:hypothetical protein P154DRAFT_498197 [Amniculicola lignicola CBS 123094]|uniref:Something about silencing protein 4 domain-containing protein n=1 Tax=Amniculicola lignicola CBS 123094 TaxID=1392246 RepID=A0A6A5W6K9_9PLEO|nr:hypothetical protein P154DRAFT_498197 [Amniculicola lignicola CBS 123094]